MTTKDETPAPKTLRDHLKAFGGALLIVATTLVLLEGLLFLTDPWGLSYFNDVLRIGNQFFELDPVRGYVMPDGTYRLSYWQVTIRDGARVTPATNPDAGCTLVMLGDSVTFGHGVNDDDVWVNHLARAFPDVHFINTGLSTYNSANVLGSKQAFSGADGYLYLVIDNDIEPTLNPDPEAFPGQNPTRLPYLVRYVNFAMFGRKPETFTQDIPPLDAPKMQRFFSDLDALLADDDVWLISFDYFALVDVMREQGYEVTAFAYPPHTISYVDSHLNPQGNREFAAALTPYVQSIVDTVCDNT